MPQGGRSQTAQTAFQGRQGPGQTADSGTLPAFPATDRTQAQTIARDFLDKVLDGTLEAAQFDPAGSAPSTVSGQYRFSGTITRNCTVSMKKSRHK